mmetsp:Transcript_105905/g.252662  ORF Transcript_105905/g.252662 Transcript_105905/m.252662 type:complete len:200 (-) Transcript_105905:96-695(-)
MRHGKAVAAGKCSDPVDHQPSDPHEVDTFQVPGGMLQDGMILLRKKGGGCEEHHQHPTSDDSPDGMADVVGLFVLQLHGQRGHNGDPDAGDGVHPSQEPLPGVFRGISLCHEGVPMAHGQERVQGHEDAHGRNRYCASVATDGAWRLFALAASEMEHAWEEAEEAAIEGIGKAAGGQTHTLCHSHEATSHEPQRQKHQT